MDAHRASVERYGQGKTYFHSSLSTTNPTPTGLKLNPRSRDDIRATNRLSYGMSQFIGSSDHQPEEQCYHPHSPVNWHALITDRHCWYSLTSYYWTHSLLNSANVCKSAVKQPTVVGNVAPSISRHSLLPSTGCRWSRDVMLDSTCWLPTTSRDYDSNRMYISTHPVRITACVWHHEEGIAQSDQRHITAVIRWFCSLHIFGV